MEKIVLHQKSEMDVRGWIQQAVTFFGQKRYPEARKLLENALAVTPKNAEVFYLLGGIALAQEDHAQALHFFSHALRINPSHHATRLLVVKCLKIVSFSRFDPLIFEAIEICLGDETLPPFSRAWLEQLMFHPSFHLFNRLQDAQTEEMFISFLQGNEENALFTHPYFLGGVAQILINKPEYETFHTRLRHYALAHREVLNAWSWLPLLAALAHYHFLSEYVSVSGKEEDNAIQDLAGNLNKDSSLVDILLVACYQPLVSVPQASALSAILKRSSIPAAQKGAKLWLEDFVTEAAIREKIMLWGKLATDISEKVQAQYEENPYPRWQRIGIEKPKPMQHVVQDLFPFLAPGEINIPHTPKILIAGCGTGYQPAISSQRFANASILALDLSRASLAYAIRKTNEYGIQNIDFKHADLLELNALTNEKFDLIESTGVLHHLADPMAGWRVLRNLLKPTGFMKIALYSEFARQSVVAARQFIAEQEYQPSVEGIRECRQALRNLPKEHPANSITQQYDFYSTSNCRDLIFHVQEHRFTILQIEAALAELELEFLGFEFEDHQSMKMYLAEYGKQDPQGKNLLLWHAFEQKNPNIFAGMYQMWLRPVVG